MAQRKPKPVDLAKLPPAPKARRPATAGVGMPTGRLGRPQMSARKPAPMNLARPDGVESEVAPKALSLWAERQVTAAKGENVIPILETIGYDWWTGGGVTAQGVMEILKRLDGQPVTVQINSPGGDFFEGLAIYNALAQYPGEVTVQVIGLAASAASLIMMSGDTIEIAKAGFVMIHNSQWCACGDRHMMHETGDIMEKFDAVIADVYADRVGKDAKAIAELLDAETWMGGADAVAEGFADQLMSKEPSKDGAKQSLVYRLDAALAQSGMPRSERRKLLKELGTPSAAPDDPTPGAGETADFTDPLGLKSFIAA